MTTQRKWPEIERRRGLGPEEFIESYLRKNRPVVIEGAAERWKHRWTPELLKERFGDREIEVETAHLFVNDRKKGKIPLAEMIDSAMGDSLKYRVRSFSFLSRIQELQDEYRANNDYERYLGTSGRLRNAFWISPPGNRTVLHNDTFYENLNVQIYGHKRFILMPPSDYKLMYSYFLSESPVNPLDPDLTKYPQFTKARIQETVLNPGDIMFVPQFWWHYVTALDFTINVNTFLRADRKSMWHATKQLPFAQRTIYRVLHNEKMGRFIHQSEQRIYRAYNAVFGKKQKKDDEAAAAA